MCPTDIAYRKTAVEGASGFGLLIALFDTLAGDLRRAAAAQRAKNIEERTRQLNHALQVVGFLENWVDAESGELAKKMIIFYTRMRAKILEAQTKQSAEILEEQMNSTISIREVWQRLDLHAMATGPEILPPAPAPSYGTYIPPQMEARRQMSWSA
jgi:flagellar protein FliS